MGQTVREVKTYKNRAGEPLFHVVRFAEGGFVVMAPDDGILPVIAFSEGDDLVRDTRNALWVMLNQDLPQRLSENRKKAPAAKKTIRAEWAALQSGGSTTTNNPGVSSVSDVRVSPLVKSKWSQSTVGGKTCYNYYTPNNDVCGCAATACAQLMRYHTYPTASVAVASYSIWVDNTAYTAALKGGVYAWSDMPWVPSSPTDAQRQAIGRLTYDVGVASHMAYASSGSSASLPAVAEALRTTFSFSSAVWCFCRDFSDKAAVIQNGILSNLDAKFPVLLSIRDTDANTGHAVVADGYGYASGILYTHINMGWSGSNDAWYNLPSVEDYDLIQDLAFNVFPQQTGAILSGRVLSASGSACNGATVYAVNSAAGTSFTTTTDSNGVFAVIVPSPSSSSLGTYQVTALHNSLVASAVSAKVTSSVCGKYSLSGSSSFSVKSNGSIGNQWGVAVTLPGTAVLSLAPSQQTADVTGGTYSLSVSGNVRWTASTAQSWITVNTVSSLADGTLSYTVAPTVSAKSRTGIITVAGAGVTQTCAVTQAAHIVPLAVTCDAQGGSVDPENLTATNGLAYGTLPTPTRTGYCFMGWWTGPSGAGARVVSSTEVTAETDHTLYAKWTVDSGISPSENGDALTSVGSYDGYLYAESAFGTGTVSAVQGTLSLTVSSLAGKLTAKATLQTGTVSFTGKNWSGTNEDGTVCAVLAAKTGETLSLYARQNQIWGSLAGGKAGDGLTLDGARNRFASTKDTEAQTLLSGYTAYYTVSLPASEALSLGSLDAAPQGAGYLAITVSKGGSAKIAGVLADGTTVSMASRLIWYSDLGSDVCVPLFAPLYSKKGWIGGLLWIGPDTRAVVTDADRGWYVRWEKPGSGPDGFRERLGACGGYYNTLPSLASRYLFGAELESVAYTYSGGTVEWVTNALPQEIAVTAVGTRLTMASGTKPTASGGVYTYSGGNAALATLSFTAKTGIFKGKFNVYYDYALNGKSTHTTVSVPYAGVLVPVRDGAYAEAAAGLGYCLVPDNDATAKTYKIKRSFAVTLGAE